MNEINIFCAEVEEKAEVAGNIRNRTTPRPSDGREYTNGEVIANLLLADQEGHNGMIISFPSFLLLRRHGHNI